jgi:SAM-dependent methyltransferase
LRVASDIEHNRNLWALVNEQYTDERAEEAWAQQEITWGLFGIPERELGALGDVRGLDIIELGSGTAYVSAWLARAGARPVAIDLSRHQLQTARRCQQRFGLAFPLVEADGEAVPIAGDRFDVVISEFGASAWCDPRRWLPEAARLLRPGGRLVFLTNSVLAGLCVPEDEGVAQEQLLRPQRDLFRVHWPGGGVEYHPAHGDWIRELRAAGFVVDALHELYAPPGAGDHEYYDIASAAWAHQWPAEDLWIAHLAG